MSRASINGVAGCGVVGCNIGRQCSLSLNPSTATKTDSIITQKFVEVFNGEHEHADYWSWGPDYRRALADATAGGVFIALQNRFVELIEDTYQGISVIES